jgi:excisionase family DNA binding protein
MCPNNLPPFRVVDPDHNDEVESQGMTPTDETALVAEEAGDLVRRLFSLFLAPNQEKPNRLLNAQEVAKLLNTNSQVVYRLARNQDLPAVNLGRRMLRFSEFSVSEFIRRGGVTRAA